jgi:hypothetical protein
MKALICFFVLFAQTSLQARFVNEMPFDTQKKEADLIVIATPTKTVNTDELWSYPDVKTISFDPKTKEKTVTDTKGLGVETTFRVLAILKGDEEIKNFVLHHYRKLPSEKPVINGVTHLSFDTNKGDVYIMFLKREKDGRYSAVVGQADPKNSIIQLETHNTWFPRK